MLSAVPAVSLVAMWVVSVMLVMSLVKKVIAVSAAAGCWRLRLRQFRDCEVWLVVLNNVGVGGLAFGGFDWPS